MASAGDRGCWKPGAGYLAYLAVWLSNPVDPVHGLRVIAEHKLQRAGQVYSFFKP